jgi:hypothetical protein
MKTLAVVSALALTAAFSSAALAGDTCGSCGKFGNSSSIFVQGEDASITLKQDHSYGGNYARTDSEVQGTTLFSSSQNASDGNVGIAVFDSPVTQAQVKQSGHGANNFAGTFSGDNKLGEQNVYVEQKSTNADNYAWNRMIQTSVGTFTGIQEGKHNDSYFDSTAKQNTVTIGQKGNDNSFKTIILGSPTQQQTVYVEQHSWDQAASWDQPSK